MTHLEPPVHDLTQITSALERLKEVRADQYDPVRFRQMSSLLERTRNQRPSVAAELMQKIHQGLLNYECDYEAAKDEASLLADQLDYQFPDHRDNIHQLFESGQFSALRRLAEKLRQNKRFQEGQLSDLRELCRQLEEFGLSAQADSKSHSFEEQLRQQETEALGDLSLSLGKDKLNAPGQEHSAIRLFKASKEKQYVDDIVSKAMRDKPDNPGPINPHMLAIRSLALMQELSPAYLRKFIQTMDALFWLDEAKIASSL